MPWDQQDHPQNETYYEHVVLWAAETDNLAVLRAALDKLVSWVAERDGPAALRAALDKFVLWAAERDSPAVLSAALDGLVSLAMERDSPAVLRELDRLRNTRDSGTGSAYLASLKGKEFVILHLLELGAKHDLPGVAGAVRKRLIDVLITALQTAARRGHLATVSQLIKCGAVLIR